MINWLTRLLPQRASPRLRGEGQGNLTREGQQKAQTRLGQRAPCFAFDRLASPAEAPRDYAASAREGFMQNPLLYRAVRMIAEAAGSVPLLLYQGEEEISEHPLLDLLARPN